MPDQGMFGTDRYPEPLDLDAIWARADAATPGEWVVRGDEIWNGDETIIYHQDEQGGESWNTDADAEFIAHARTDVPALLAEVERLREGILQLVAEAAGCDARHHKTLWALLGDVS